VWSPFAVSHPSTWSGERPSPTYTPWETLCNAQTWAPAPLESVCNDRQALLTGTASLRSTLRRWRLPWTADDQPDPLDSRGMELDNRSITPSDNPQVLALFGQATLLRSLDGRVELRGGSEQDREHARQWMERFMRPATPGVERPHARTTV